MTSVWNTVTQASVNAACIRKPSPPSESEAPRYETAEMPKNAPDAMPISAVFSVRLCSRLRARMSVVATEIAITPTRLTRIATPAPSPIGSPRITTPKIAVCTVSVLE